MCQLLFQNVGLTINLDSQRRRGTAKGKNTTLLFTDPFFDPFSEKAMADNELFLHNYLEVQNHIAKL